jgi:hypothetical protein
MGMNLFDEFADHAPDELTPRERWVGGILAKDANDGTRLTFHSVIDPLILRKARVNQREMYKILARLQNAKVIEKETAGYTNSRARYRFLPLADDCVSSSDTQYGEGVDSGHPQGPDEGVRSGSDCLSESGREGVQTGYERVSSSDTPTPPPLPSPPPSSWAVPEQRAKEGGGGGGSSLEQAAIRFVDELPYRGQRPDRRQREDLITRVAAALADGWQQQGLHRQLTTDTASAVSLLSVYAYRLRADVLPRPAVKALRPAAVVNDSADSARECANPMCCRPLPAGYPYDLCHSCNDIHPHD